MEKKITLATLHEATQQEIFDTCKEHLLKQGNKSVDACGGLCMYRGPNGLQCAAGIFISDEEYNEGMENGRIIDFAYAHCSKDPEHEDIVNKNINLLLQLQRIHDSSSVDGWSDALMILARSEGLNP